MADFQKAVKTVLLHEGKLVDNKSDPGGMTNFGISLRFLEETGHLTSNGWKDGDINHDGKIDWKDVNAMTEDKATQFYFEYFWKPNGYGKIESQEIATKIFDLAVNMGSYVANKVAQRAVRASIGLRLEEDGIIGLKTIAAFNMCKPEILMAALKAEAAGYYRAIRYSGANNFSEGWLRRAYDNIIVE